MTQAPASRAPVTPAAGPRVTLAVLGSLVALLLVAVGLRAGVVAALVVAGIAVLLVAVAAGAFVLTERRRLAAAAPAKPADGVKHCDCCDRACLMAKVCAPGPEPTVVHEPAVS